MNRTTPFDEMDRLFDQMRRSMLSARPALDGDATPVDGRGGTSNVRVDANDDGHVVTLDVPGFERDEIDLRLDDCTLTVDAVHETEADDGVRSRHFHERITVPGVIDVEAAAASYHNGVLEVRLPVETGDNESHRIDVE
jgi:HSP20 family protein